MQPWSAGAPARAQELRAASQRHCDRSTGPLLEPPARSYKLAMRRSLAARTGFAQIARSTEVRAPRQLKLGRGFAPTAATSLFARRMARRWAARVLARGETSPSCTAAEGRGPKRMIGRFVASGVRRDSTGLSAVGDPTSDTGAGAFVSAGGELACGGGSTHGR